MWFATGDVATIDADGFMQITDRSKDVIKSGGEWISSIELENIAMAHPAVLEAAVIACRHPKWDERPLLVVVRNRAPNSTARTMLAFYDGKVARWQVPDDVVFVDDIPHTATGKMLKLKLRQQFLTSPVGTDPPDPTRRASHHDTRRHQRHRPVPAIRGHHQRGTGGGLQRLRGAAQRTQRCGHCCG
jgi:acyl-CoA synthetase (AMP-forming)/AMP-acid ligase II